MTARWIAAALVALTGCGETPTLRPRVIAPSAQSDAYPFAAVDELVLSIARAGDSGDIALVAADIGDDLGLSDIDFAEDLVVHLSGLTDGVELAYGRSCVVDVMRGEVPEPALYFSRVARWAEIEGGNGSGGATLGYGDSRGRGVFVDPGSGEVSLFDPALGEWRGFDGSVPPRPGAVLTPLEEGRSALLVGGDSPDAGTVWLAPGDAEAAAELRRSDIVSAEPGTGAVVEHDAVTLTDGSVLTTGGRAGDIVRRRAYLIAVAPSGPVRAEQLLSDMISARAGHTLTRLGDDVGADVIVIGGVNNSGQGVAECEIYRPLRRSFEPLPGTTLNVPRFGHRSIRLPSGFVLVVGGFSRAAGGDPEPVRALELFDPVLSTFTMVGDLPVAAGISGHSVAQLPDGRILLSGGRDIDGNPTRASFIVRFDPIDGGVDVVATGSMVSSRTEAALVSLCDGTVMVVGGSGLAERYNPSSAARR